MKQTEYPLLDETAFRQTLPNGLRVTVVPRKGFQKKIAYFVTDFGSIHTAFRLDGKNTGFRRALPTIWSTSCLTCRETGMFPRSSRSWGPMPTPLPAMT